LVVTPWAKSISANCALPTGRSKKIEVGESHV